MRVGNRTFFKYWGREAARHGVRKGLIVTAVSWIFLMVLAACSSDPDAGATEEAGEANGAREATPTIETSTPTPTLDDKRALVVRELRSMTKLETTVYSLEKVIEAEREGEGLFGFLGDESLLLIAHGVVTAGVDLSALDDNDVVVVDEVTVRVTLPETVIFQSTLEEDDTRVIDRETGLLAEESAELEMQALEEAETLILEGSCEQGILEDAAEAAQTRVASVLTYLEFQSVTVDAPSGSCGPSAGGTP